MIRTDLEKSLNLTFGPGKLLGFEKSAFCLGIVLEVCKIFLENMNKSLKNIKYNESFWIMGCTKKNCLEIARYTPKREVRLVFYSIQFVRQSRFLSLESE